MMPDVTQVNAFSDFEREGNAAGVCLMDAYPPDEQMQKIASAVNFSETAFLVPSGTQEFSLRWFSPFREVERCGHATLASAYFLWVKGYADPSLSIRFTTLSGPLSAERRRGSIWLDFPRDRAMAWDVPKGISDSLPEGWRDAVRGEQDGFIRLPGFEDVRDFRPDLEGIRNESLRGLAVTAAGVKGSPDDFVLRFFAPAYGIDEDPVTGSVCCLLGPWWGEKLKKTELQAYQASSKGGTILIGLSDSRRVHLGGQAVMIGHLSSGVT